MEITQNAFITLKKCGKNDRVDKQGNGNTGVPDATSTNAAMVDLKFKYNFLVVKKLQ